MAEEQLRYKVVVDASDVPAYLDSIKSQVNMALTQASGTGYMPDPSSAFTPVNYAPSPQLGPVTDYSSQTGMGQYMQRTSDIMQQGYYKATEMLTTANLTRQTMGMQFSDYFNMQKRFTADMDPLQMVTGLTGLGYDPYTNPLSFGEMQNAIRQRIADNSTIGMMDYSFGELVGSGAALGSSVGGWGGFGGMLAGAGVGAVGGAGLWLANEVASPFASEATFRRNITRGLKEYSRYATTGYMEYDERNSIADLVANMDLDPALLGTNTTRDNVKDMFDTAMGTSYIQSSATSGDMKDKLQKFMQGYTKLMHITGKAGKELGDFVDAMQDAGLLDMNGGDLVSSTSALRGMGMAARLMGTDQALQVYQAGSEMMRGTGINMGAGGEVLLNNLADVANMLRNRELKEEDIRQLGGQYQAAATLTQNAYQTSISPVGQAIGFGIMNGGYDPSMNTGQAFVSGMSGIGSYNQYMEQMVKYNQFLGGGGMDLVQMSDTASKLKLFKDAGFIEGNDSYDEIALKYANLTGVALPTAKLLISNASRSEESIMQGFNEEVAQLRRTAIGERPTDASIAMDSLSKSWTRMWRGVGSWINPGNTEVNPEWYTKGYLASSIHDSDLWGKDISASDMLSDTAKARFQYYLRNGSPEASYSRALSGSFDPYLGIQGIADLGGFSDMAESVGISIGGDRESYMAMENAFEVARKYSNGNVDTLIQNYTNIGPTWTDTGIASGRNTYQALSKDEKGRIDSLAKEFIGADPSFTQNKINEIAVTDPRKAKMLAYKISTQGGGLAKSFGNRTSNPLQGNLSDQAGAFNSEDSTLNGFQGGMYNLRAVGLTTMGTGALASLTGVGAVAGVPLMVAGAVAWGAGAIGTIALDAFTKDVGEIYDITGDGEWTDADEMNLGRMSEAGARTLASRRGYTSDQTAKFMDEWKNAKRMTDASIEYGAYRFISGDLMSGLSSAQSYAKSHQKELGLSDADIAALSMENGKFYRADRVQAVLNKNNGALRSGLEKEDPRNIILDSVDQMDVRNIANAASSSVQLADSLARQSILLREEARVASEVRTSIAPDGSITQSRDPEAMQKTSMEALNTLVDIGRHHLNVSRALLIHQARPDDQEKQNEVSMVIDGTDYVSKG